MKKILLFTLPVLGSLSMVTASAQEVDSTTKEGVHVKLSVNYNSAFNYYGRTDSLKSKGFYPLAELWLGSKLYVNAAPIFVYNKMQTPTYSGSVATVGYLAVSSKWISNLYVLKPFYTASAQLVQSAMKAQAGASFTALNKVLNLSFGGTVSYSNKIDATATAGVDHIFRIPIKNSRIIIDPSFTATAGTQNFSKTYQQKTGGLFPRQQQVTKSYQQFNLLSLEASLPIIYTRGHWQLMATPSFVVPKNLIQDSDQPGQSEQGEKMFYSTMTVKYSL